MTLPSEEHTFVVVGTYRGLLHTGYVIALEAGEAVATAMKAWPGINIATVMSEAELRAAIDLMERARQGKLPGVKVSPRYSM